MEMLRIRPLVREETDTGQSVTILLMTFRDPDKINVEMTSMTANELLTPQAAQHAHNTVASR